MIPRRRIAALAAAVLALTALVAGGAASAAGPRAEKLPLPGEVGNPDEVLAYGPSQLLLLTSFVQKPGLFRINNDGSLDRSFGNDGKVDAYHGGVTVAPDGKILLASAKDGDGAVTRLLPDGSPDPSFGHEGTALIDFGGAYDGAGSVAVAPNGSIIVGGTRQTIVDNRGLSDAVPAIGRLLPDGTVDQSFAENGKRILAEGWEAGVSHVASLPGGGIVATGEGYIGLVVWKLTGAGRMNRKFGKHGVLHLAEGRGWHHGYDWEEELSWGEEVVVLPSGKLLLSGNGERYDDRGSHYRAVALRLKPNGRIDRSFGHRGWVTATFGGDTFAHKLVPLPHGISVLVVGGWSLHGKYSDLGAVAFNRRGRPYRHFGRRGKVRVDLHRQDSTDDATAQGGRLVILGYDQEVQGWLVGVPNL